MFNKDMENVYEKYDYYMCKLNHDYDFYVENALDVFEAEDASQSFKNKVSAALTKLKDTIIAFFKKVMNEIKIMITKIRAKKMLRDIRKMNKTNVKTTLKSYQVPNIGAIQRRYDMYVKTTKKLEKEYMDDIKKAVKSKNKDLDSIGDLIYDKTEEFKTKVREESKDCMYGIAQYVDSVMYQAYIKGVEHNVSNLEKMIRNDIAYCEKELDYGKIMDEMIYWDYKISDGLDVERNNSPFSTPYKTNAKMADAVDPKGKFHAVKESTGSQLHDHVANAIVSAHTEAAKLTQRKDNMIYSNVKQQFTKVYGSVDNKD
jgi:hypothetical protein